MGKRKHRPVLHQQEQCDVWLSTAEKKEQTPSVKRQRVFRPITNIADFVLSSQPIKAGTKQTDIKNFFAPKAAKVKEETVPNASSSSSSSPQSLSKESSTSSSSNITRSRKLVTEHLPSQKCQNAGGFRSRQNNDAETTFAISITSPRNRSFNLTESVYVPPVCKIVEDIATLMPKTKESDFTASAQDLKVNELSQFSQDVPQISSASQESEDITFIMDSQGCWKAKDLKTNRHMDFDTLDTQEHLNADAVCYGVSVKPGDILDSPYSQSILDIPNVTKTSAHYDSSENEESEDISFTMGTEGCLKMKLSNLKAGDSRLSDTPDNIHESSSLSSQDSTQGVIFTMGSQGCLKVRDPKGHRSNLTPSPPSEDLSQDVAFTMGTQSCSKVRGHRSNITPSPPSEDSSQDVAFTVGTQGCLKVRDPKSRRSNITPSPLSEDLSQDIAFTMGTQGCLNVRDHRGHQSNITQPLTQFDSIDLSGAINGNNNSFYTANMSTRIQNHERIKHHSFQSVSGSHAFSRSQDVSGTDHCKIITGIERDKSIDSDTPYCDDIELDVESDDDEFSQTQDG